MKRGLYKVSNLLLDYIAEGKILSNLNRDRDTYRTNLFKIKYSPHLCNGKWETNTYGIWVRNGFYHRQNFTHYTRFSITNLYILNKLEKYFLK